MKKWILNHLPKRKRIAKSRPEWDEYFMNIAVAVAQRANCLRGDYRVGAVIVNDEYRVLSTGYNGTPTDMQNCIDEGGCTFCAEKKLKGVAELSIDSCICVHAEQNALLAAARFGIAIDGATIYTTVQPCSTCSKELAQTNIKRIVYFKNWRADRPANEKQELRYLQAHFKIFKQEVTLPVSFELKYDEVLVGEKKAA
jgi:dCMP deaminase